MKIIRAEKDKELCNSLKYLKILSCYKKRGF